MTLTDDQIHQIRTAAAMLPTFQRDDFVRSIANRLRDLPYTPTDADVHGSITLVLSARGVSVPRGDSHGYSVRRRQRV
jgi:hypothetical protein